MEKILQAKEAALRAKAARIGKSKIDEIMNRIAIASSRGDNSISVGWNTVEEDLNILRSNGYKVTVEYDDRLTLEKILSGYAISW